MSSEPLHLAFLWHMHQPYYKNVLTGKYTMPWVRLHGTKDYLDMVKILEEFPAVKQTFNIVPSLGIQIEDYVNRTADDPFLEITKKPAKKLTPDDKKFILHNFFLANWDTMVEPFPRYSRLLTKRGRHCNYNDLDEIQGWFTIQEMLDLQVWFNLAWIDPLLIEADPELKNLREKGETFTEQEKSYVIESHYRIMGEIIPYYKKMQDEGSIEVTTTPFYHPIMPLLYKSDLAREAMPECPLPQHGIHHPEDVREQLRKAVKFHESRFGRPPRGMWPSEGSVAEDIIPFIAETGIEWIATDEGVLARSLNKDLLKNSYGELENPDMLYKAYRVGQDPNQLSIVFRDHTLSDRIGFVYSKMDPHDAAADFIHRLESIRKRLDAKGAKGPKLVSVILDGENAWEYYKNDGVDFLRKLYAGISESKTLEAVTVSGFLDKFPPKEHIPRLFAGSWINNDFHVWIGHEEDNQSWDYLEETRRALTARESDPKVKLDKKKLQMAWEEIYIAEGSDWNWWYGPDHASSLDEEFDALYRAHLGNVYELIGLEKPAFISVPIKSKADLIPTLEPMEFISPSIDGKITNFYEWESAGLFEAKDGGGAMHRSENIIRSIYYGFNESQFYIRIDFNKAIKDYEIEDVDIISLIVEPNDLRLKLPLSIAVRPVMEVRTDGNKWEKKEAGIKTAFSTVLEAAIPFADAGIKPGDKVKLQFLLRNKGKELERCPSQGTIAFEAPTEDYTMRMWSV